MISIEMIKKVFEQTLAELAANAAIEQQIRLPFRSKEWFEYANRRRMKSAPIEKSVLLKGPKEWGEVPEWIQSSGCTSMKSTRAAYASFWSSFTLEASPSDSELFAKLKTEAKTDLALGSGTVRIPDKNAYYLEREKAYAKNLRAFCERLQSGSVQEFTRFEILNYVFPPRRTGEVNYTVFNFGTKSRKLNHYDSDSDTISFAIYKGSFSISLDKSTGEYISAVKPPEVFPAFFERELPRLTPLRAYLSDADLISRTLGSVREYIRENSGVLNKFSKTDKLGFGSNDARRFYETVLVAKIFNREECLSGQRYLSHSADAANLHYRKSDMPLPEPLLPQ